MQPYKTPAGRLTEHGARTIKVLWASKDEGGKRTHTLRTISETIGVSIGTVFNVTSGKTWAWLTTK